ncbi:hypothetical protein ACTFOB_25420 [Bacillus cereus group sp. MYBK79-1]|nr:hypothetical protein [Bacillus paranthracis]
MTRDITTLLNEVEKRGFSLEALGSLMEEETERDDDRGKRDGELE